MILGLGTDIVSIDRIKEREHLYSHYLSEKDTEYVRKFRNHWEHAAGFWAAKEALVKALNNRRLEFTKITILHDEEGKPSFDYTPTEGVLHLSISHEKTYATATVIWETDPIL